MSKAAWRTTGNEKSKIVPSKGPWIETTEDKTSFDLI